MSSRLVDDRGVVYFDTSQLPETPGAPVSAHHAAPRMATVRPQPGPPIRHARVDYGYGTLPPERAAAAVAIHPPIERTIQRPIAPRREPATTGTIVTILCVLTLAAALVAIGLHEMTPAEDVATVTPAAAPASAPAPAPTAAPAPAATPAPAAASSAAPAVVEPRVVEPPPVATPAAAPDATAKSAPSSDRPPVRKKRARKRASRSVEPDSTEW